MNLRYTTVLPPFVTPEFAFIPTDAEAPKVFGPPSAGSVFVRCFPTKLSDGTPIAVVRARLLLVAGQSHILRGPEYSLVRASNSLVPSIHSSRIQLAVLPHLESTKDGISLPCRSPSHSMSSFLSEAVDARVEVFPHGHSQSSRHISYLSSSDSSKTHSPTQSAYSRRACRWLSTAASLGLRR